MTSYNPVQEDAGEHNILHGHTPGHTTSPRFSFDHDTPRDASEVSSLTGSDVTERSTQQSGENSIPDVRSPGIALRNISRKYPTTVVNPEELDGDDSEGSNWDVGSVKDGGNLRSRWHEKLVLGRRRQGTRRRKDKREEPKIPLSQNSAKAFAHFLLFHTIPVGVALALIILNIKTRYLGLDGKWLGALQFAAKVHEMWMQFSIITVMTAYLQRLLVHERAIPLGAIFSAYQVTQMSYLWSPEFRAALTTPGFDGVIKTIFVCFVPLSILLAAGVGPSSAIAMQPRAVNFTVPDDVLAFNFTSDALYPDAFDMAGLPLVFNNDAANELSPAAGWQYLQDLPSVGGDPSATFNNRSIQVSGAYGDEGVETGLQISFTAENVQTLIMPTIYSIPIGTFGPHFASSPGAAVDRTISLQFAPNSTFVTTQSVPVALALAQAASDATDIFSGTQLGQFRPGVVSINMAQPFVSVYCQPNTIVNENDTRPIQFPETYLAGCGDEQTCANSFLLNQVGIEEYNEISRKDIWDEWRLNPGGRIMWIDNMTVHTPAEGSALGAIVVQPELCMTGSPYLMTSACVIGSVWANVTAQVEQSFKSWIKGAGNAPAQNSLSTAAFSSLPQWSQPAVRLSKTWADSLSPMTDVQNRSVVDNLLRLMPATSNVCPLNGTYSGPLYESETPDNSQLEARPYMHERLLGSLIANGMSHAAGGIAIWEKNIDSTGSSDTWQTFVTNNPEDPNVTYGDYAASPPGMTLRFHGHVPGFGWNLDGVPIKIAVPILILYCIYALSYGVYTLITGRSSTTWRSISDLVALAMNSTPSSALKNTSCGVGRTETYRKLVSVREVENHRRVELVFQQDEDNGGTYRRVVVGHGY